MTEKIAGSNYLVRTLNTLFNPFEYEDILSPPNATPFSRALHHAGGLAVGYGGLAVVLRKMMQYKTQLDRKKQEDKLRSYAAAKYPTLSADPRKDTEEEEMLESPGVEDVADLPELTKAAASGLFQMAAPVQEVVKKTVWGTQDPAHLALAAAAAVMGGTAGWKLADYIEDKRRAKELKSRVDTAADDIDSMLYEEMQRRSQKVANTLSPENISRNTYRGAEVASGTGQEGPGTLYSVFGHPGRTLKGVETLWWLWAVAAFALTYKAAKSYGDLKDPNRRRVKQLQEIAKERAKQKQAPVMMDVGSMPTASRTRNVSTEAVQPEAPLPQVMSVPTPKAPTPPATKPEPRSLAADMGKGPEVDKDDPYAHLLTT